MSRKNKLPTGPRRWVLWVLVLTGILGLSCRAVSMSLPGVDEIQGSGNIVSENRSVEGFERLSIRNTGIVNLTQGTRPALTVTTDDNLMEYVTTVVQGDTLIFDLTEELRSQNIDPTQPITFDLVVVNLEAIRIAGSADLRGAALTTGVLDLAIDGSGDIRFDSLTTSDLELSIDGSGDIQIGSTETGDLAIRVGGSGDIDLAQLNADAVQVDIFGSGNLELSGMSNSQEISIIGSGDYRAKELASSIVEIRIPGSGTATVWATESLDVSIQGSGDVRYYGEPMVTQSITGSGDIRSMGIP